MLCVLVFFTPPVAMYHHYLSVLEPVLSADSLEKKNQGQKCVLGGSTVRQKSQKIHLCCFLKLAILWFTYSVQELVFIIPWVTYVYISVYVYVCIYCCYVLPAYL